MSVAVMRGGVRWLRSPFGSTAAREVCECVRVNVRFVWGAFVSCWFACGCVLELAVCRVRFARVSCPRLRFENGCMHASLKIFWKFMFSYWVSQSTPTLRPGVAGYDIPTASALGDCSTVCWMDGWQTCHARMRFSVLRGSQSHVRQNVA